MPILSVDEDIGQYIIQLNVKFSPPLLQPPAAAAPFRTLLLSFASSQAHAAPRLRPASLLTLHCITQADTKAEAEAEAHKKFIGS